MENLIECENCGKYHSGSYGSGRFCDVTCARAFSTKLKRMDINERVSLKLRRTVPFICHSCGNSYPTSRSLAAHRISHSRKFEDLKQDSTRKKWLLKERGHQCEVCKTKEWMGKQIPIELDHVNGNADDNRKENLRLICPNCHAQTETYKSKNVASLSRRSRYIRNIRVRSLEDQAPDF